MGGKGIDALKFERYWLFDWLSEAGIRTVEDAQKALERGSSALRPLRERAEDAEGSLWDAASDGTSILAGTGLDLTGNLACYHANCRKDDVDSLFRRAWHYFDRVVVADQVTHNIARHWDEAPPEAHADRMLSQIEVLLHIRRIGAQDLVEFRKKSPVDTALWEERVGQSAVAEVAQSAQSIRLVLEEEARIEPDKDRAGVWWLNHRLLRHVQVAKAPATAGGDPGDSTVRKKVVGALMSRFSGYLFSDLASQKRAGVPLASCNEIHGKMVAGQGGDSLADVVLALELPFLADIPIKTLIKVRRDEADHFARLQPALRKAISERLRLDPDADSAKVAKEIQDDLITPELNAIRSRLSAAHSALQKKAALGAGVSMFASTCAYVGGPDLVSLLGLAVPLGIGAQAAATYFDKAADVEDSDMFFFWKAAKHDQNAGH